MRGLKDLRETGKKSADEGPKDNDPAQFSLLLEKNTAIIGEMLQKYVLPPPEEKEVDRTVSALTYMVGSMKERRCLSRILNRYLAVVLQVMKYSGKGYVLVCLFLYSLAAAAVLKSMISPYIPSMVLGPVPFLLAMAGAFKSRSLRMAELEMSFKYSLKQLIMGKFFLTAVLNTLCNFLLALVALQSNAELNAVRMTLLWCAPFMAVSAISLAITIKVRSFNASLGCLGIWSVLAMVISANPGWMKFLTEGVKTGLYGGVTVVSGFTLVYLIVVYLAKTIERGDFIDTYIEEHIKAI